MKIKGVQGGPNKGQALEFTPEEKPAVVLEKDAVPRAAPAGELWYAKNVIVTKLDYGSNGAIKQGYQNNHYVADGTFDLHVLRTAQDELQPKQTKSFHVEFKDIVDGTGQPDMEVTAFTIA